MGSALSNVLTACSWWEQPPGIFCCRGGGGREVVAPLTNEEVGGVAGHHNQCPLAKVCHGGTALAHLARACGD